MVKNKWLTPEPLYFSAWAFLPFNVQAAARIARREAHPKMGPDNNLSILANRTPGKENMLPSCVSGLRQPGNGCTARLSIRRVAPRRAATNSRASRSRAVIGVSERASRSSR